MTLSWLYSTGFPKSLDVSKSLAKRAGGNLRAREAIDFMRLERERIGLTRIELEKRIFGRSDGNVRNWEDGISIPRPGLWPKIREALELSTTPFDADMERGDAVVGEVAGSYGYQKDRVRWTEIHELREPTTDLARQWEGWGTSLKPAHEPILLFQKPLYSAESRTESLPMIDLFPDDKTRWLIHNGDCLEVLKGMPDESVDAVISDPPYGLSGHSATDVQDALRAWLDGKPYLPKGAGFMGANWDSFVPGPEVWRECFRVLKPGGHLLAFAGTRTQDLMGIAIRLAGFDCRDEIRVDGILSWTFGSGFPKSLSVGKAIDKAAGAEREVVGVKPGHEQFAGRTTKGHIDFKGGTEGFDRPWMHDDAKREAYHQATTPATDAAKQWEGWGTALKPSHEPVLMYRKPLAGTVVQNVQQHGTGAINIDGCRVSTSESLNGGAYAKEGTERHDGAENWRYKREGGAGDFKQPTGRWPSNLVLCHTPDCRQAGTKTVEAPVINRFDDGMKPFGEGAGHAYTSTGGGQEEIPVWECVEGCPVKALDGQSGIQKDGVAGKRNGVNGYEGGWATVDTVQGGYGGEGGASRFFPQFQYTPEDAPFRYVPKANRTERNEGLEGKAAKQVDESRDSDAPGANNPRNRGGRSDENHHPTVKPIELMRWLVRLVTQPGGIVLDPFNGSGSTGCAAILEGMRYVGIELDPDYAEIARTRITHHELKGRGGIKNPWTSEAPREEVTDQAATSMADLFGFGDE